MCALQLPMSQVMSNTSVMAITDLNEGGSEPLPSQIFLGGGGGGTTLLRRLRSKKNRSSYAVSS